MWTDALLSDSRAVVDQLLEQPATDLGVLRHAVTAYRGALEDAGPMADREIADKLVTGSLALIDAVQGADCPRRLQLASVAVRYFVLDDDGDDDLASFFGLDDDVEVFNAVVDELDLGSLRIS